MTLNKTKLFDTNLKSKIIIEMKRKISNDALVQLAFTTFEEIKAIKRVFTINQKHN